MGSRIVDRRVLHLIKMWLECPGKKPPPALPGFSDTASVGGSRSSIFSYLVDNGFRMLAWAVRGVVTKRGEV